MTSDERKAVLLIAAGVLVAATVSHVIGLGAILVGLLWVVFGD